MLSYVWYLNSFGGRPWPEWARGYLPYLSHLIWIFVHFMQTHKCMYCPSSQGKYYIICNLYIISPFKNLKISKFQHTAGSNSLGKGLWAKVSSCYSSSIWECHFLYVLTNTWFYTLFSSLSIWLLKIVSEVGTFPELSGHSNAFLISVSGAVGSSECFGPSSRWWRLGLLNLCHFRTAADHLFTSPRGPLAQLPASALPLPSGSGSFSPSAFWFTVVTSSRWNTFLLIHPVIEWREGGVVS